MRHLAEGSMAPSNRPLAYNVRKRFALDYLTLERKPLQDPVSRAKLDGQHWVGKIDAG